MFLKDSNKCRLKLIAYTHTYVRPCRASEEGCLQEHERKKERKKGRRKKERRITLIRSAEADITTDGLRGKKRSKRKERKRKEKVRD